MGIHLSSRGLRSDPVEPAIGSRRDQTINNSGCNPGIKANYNRNREAVQQNYEHLDRKDALIKYIKNQEAHHRTTTFREEYIALLTEHGISYEEKYLLQFNPCGVVIRDFSMHGISCRVIKH